MHSSGKDSPSVLARAGSGDSGRVARSATPETPRSEARSVTPVPASSVDHGIPGALTSHHDATCAEPSSDAAWDGKASLPTTPDLTFYEKRGKRMLDITVCGIALFLALPVFLALFIAIKLEDGGPIFYFSSRVGKGGRLFRFIKFRSMILNADAVRDQLHNLNEVDGPVFKIENDPRVTRVGRFLRRSSLDELPQLWNILRGDMSLVGPRPPIASEVVRYEPWQLRRLSVPPGLTCLWQISGRCTIGFDEWMRLDMEYIDHHRTLTSDLRILVRTIPAVLSGEGAY